MYLCVVFPLKTSRAFAPSAKSGRAMDLIELSVASSGKKAQKNMATHSDKSALLVFKTIKTFYFSSHSKIQML
jgi:hypothetical protein